MCTPIFISPGQVSKSHFTASQSQELHEGLDTAAGTVRHNAPPTSPHYNCMRASLRLSRYVATFVINLFRIIFVLDTAPFSAYNGLVSNNRHNGQVTLQNITIILV